jgi:hypothetical protein
LSGLVIFSLRNFNVLPADFFTNYILYLGSALEAVLLSIALADKINIYKKETELSQARALNISLENEKLVKEQNVRLEEEVSNRTSRITKCEYPVKAKHGQFKRYTNAVGGSREKWRHLASLRRVLHMKLIIL